MLPENLRRWYFPIYFVSQFLKEWTSNGLFLGLFVDTLPQICWREKEKEVGLSPLMLSHLPSGTFGVPMKNLLKKWNKKKKSNHEKRLQLISNWVSHFNISCRVCLGPNSPQFAPLNWIRGIVVQEHYPTAEDGLLTLITPCFIFFSLKQNVKKIKLKLKMKIPVWNIDVVRQVLGIMGVHLHGREPLQMAPPQQQNNQAYLHNKLKIKEKNWKTYLEAIVSPFSRPTPCTQCFLHEESFDNWQIPKKIFNKQK